MTKSSPEPTKTPPRSSPEVAYESTPISSPRSLKQLSIFFLGASLFLVSTSVTRRAIHRRHLRNIPKLFEANTNPHEHFSPTADAIQALNLATMNVVSLGVMAIGGTLWAFDISGLSEMQRALRSRLGYQGFDASPSNVNSNRERTLEISILEKRKEAESSKKA
ncbi:hypothetical protein GQ43DRAFT_361296 [Delitschia confertaspora ATCC 74209]|uniref:Altered inheritance of mitochondria protein 11 n=1 Tax=Delitschia confertaspora ATCC 74209 TaxID=1513339 RepID=A0A9P4JWS7_9PLEO|nr:hypothetical protein GQ43DRAFT_361296 [Delitschia confertaspora ATCC 74209]